MGSVVSRKTTASAAAQAAPPLLETKLGPSRRRSGLALRPRLLTRLDETASVAMTVVDAPVGFGKTLLVESWLAHSPEATAWVSLDAAARLCATDSW